MASFASRCCAAPCKGGNPKSSTPNQGSQFTSPHFTGLLEAAGVQVSHDGRGRALDNIFIERLWRTVKYEEVYLKDYDTPTNARAHLSAYFDFYNQEKPHQSLSYKTPLCVYRERGAKQTDPTNSHFHTLARFYLIFLLFLS